MPQTTYAPMVQEIMEDTVRGCLEFNYISRPSETQTRYVFDNAVCLSLEEAYAYVTNLES